VLLLLVLLLLVLLLRLRLLLVLLLQLLQLLTTAADTAPAPRLRGHRQPRSLSAGVGRVPMEAEGLTIGAPETVTWL
jgi:hypothetical protein